MDLRVLDKKYKSQHNKLATHIIQSWEWGEFREEMGIKVLRYGIFENNTLKKSFQLTLHPIPLTSFSVGYLPKGPFPDKQLYDALKQIATLYKCAFIKIEPHFIDDKNLSKNIYSKFTKSPKALFTNYNFELDITPSEEDLLKNMHPKTRYNIRVAQKKGVEIKECGSAECFQNYLDLYFETTKRQNYHGHNLTYHQKAWQIMKENKFAHLLIAFYPETTNHLIPLSAWMLYKFKDTLFYPYGGSSTKYREVMANNLIAWEAIKLGKKLGLKKFDMWGSLGPNPNPKDPWYGFTRFKQGYGGKLVKYLDTYDLVQNYPIYILFTIIDKIMPLKVILLKLLKK